MTQSTNTAAAAAASNPEVNGQEVSAARKQRNKLILHVAIILVATLAIWFVPAPEGVDPRGMHMLAIFVGTILGLILQPLPTPSVALVGLGAAMITGTMAAKNEALTGFGNSSIWIIVAAFFIADGFLITGLGKRIALLFVRALGKSSLGLSYGMAITDLVLAPATPSNTARAGGVIYPIIRSLSEVNGSTNETPESRRKLGSYLLMTEAQVNTITSAMFLTAMAGNPLAQKFAHDRGINLDWGTWALAAIVPGLAALIVMPWIMSKIYPPTIKKTPDAPEHARQELHEMGPMSSKEWIMLGTFALLLILWITGTSIGIDATSAAFFGIAILLVTKVLTWKDMAKNSSAWSTLIFFAVLVGMADHLKKLKVVDWIGQQAAHSVSGMAWPMAFAILVLAYFFIHYMFASNTAQVVALYAVFLGAAVAAGVPPMFAALFLGFMGNLIGGITHYASGPAGVYYGSGYFSVGEWFKIGFMAAIVNLVVWGAVGTAWLFALGFAN